MNIMKDKINIILTFQDYFDAVSFDTAELKEKVAYVLFYVTEIAALRKDMVPKIIAHRINDQIRSYRQRVPLDQGEEIVLTTEEEISCIMSGNPTCFAVSSVGDRRDRTNEEVAYVLTKAKSNELWQEFNTNIKDILMRYKKKNLFEKTWLSLFALGFLILGIYLYLSFEYSSDVNVKNLSKRDFLELVNFKESDDEERAIFFTYYITQLTDLRKDITPHVICERIADWKYNMPSEEKLKRFFEESKFVRKSDLRDSAYVLTKQGIDKVENVINAKSRKDVVTVKWIMENVSALTVVGFFSMLITLLTTIFAWGYRTATIFRD